jgi:hypothetical protein
VNALRINPLTAVTSFGVKLFHVHSLSAADVYIRQILKFPNRLQSMSYIFIVVLRTRKRLTPKDVAAVKGLTPH